VLRASRLGRAGRQHRTISCGIADPGAGLGIVWPCSREPAWLTGRGGAAEGRGLVLAGDARSRLARWLARLAGPVPPGSSGRWFSRSRASPGRLVRGGAVSSVSYLWLADLPRLTG